MGRGLICYYWDAADGVALLISRAIRGRFFLTYNSRKSEVAQFHYAHFCNENILGFDVTMNTLKR